MLTDKEVKELLRNVDTQDNLDRMDDALRHINSLDKLIYDQLNDSDKVYLLDVIEKLVEWHVFYAAQKAELNANGIADEDLNAANLLHLKETMKKG